MFTGIVEEVGRLTAVRHQGGRRWITIACDAVLSDLAPGDSLACDGACLTAVEFTEASVTVEAMQETLAKTTAGDWQRGRRINLERALRMGGRLDGHIVQGHIDTTTRLLARREVGETLYLTVELPTRQARLVVPQGSVTLNGVSLTVSTLQSDRFEVALIGHTRRHTNLPDLRSGERLNIEFDILGKYVQRHLEGNGNKLSEEWLREQGF